MTAITAYENYIEQVKTALKFVRKAYANNPEQYRNRFTQIMDNVTGARNMAKMMGADPTELGIITINFEAWTRLEL